MAALVLALLLLAVSLTPARSQAICWTGCGLSIGFCAPGCILKGATGAMAGRADANWAVRELNAGRVAMDLMRADREGGMPIEINMTELDKSGFFSKVDNGFNKFVAPCLFSYYPNSIPGDNGTATSGSRQKKTSGKRNFLVFFCIPVSPGKSRVLFTFPRNFAFWIDRIIPRWIHHMRSNLVLDSDLYLIHVEDALEDVKESAHDEAGGNGTESKSSPTEENGKETGNDAKEITVEESQVPPPEDGREE